MEALTPDDGTPDTGGTAKHPPGLQRIVGFTITAADPVAAAEAYAEVFGWPVEAEGTVPSDEAFLWGAPAAEGKRWLRLRPPGEPRTWVRFIEQAAEPGLPFLSYGWNAMEVLVHDPYALARELEGTAFRVLIPPRPLPFDPALHAMQVIGPAGELLYCTSLPREREVFDLRAATHRVDRPFIAVLGGPDAEAMLAFYARTLATPVIAPSPVLVKVVNDAFGLAPEARIPLGIVKLPRDWLIEVDGYPPQAGPRPRPPGGLPPGIAMLTVAVRGAEGGGYAGPLPARLEGAAGEWLELVAPT